MRCQTIDLVDPVTLEDPREIAHLTVPVKELNGDTVRMRRWR